MGWGRQVLLKRPQFWCWAAGQSLLIQLPGPCKKLQVILQEATIFHWQVKKKTLSTKWLVYLPVPFFPFTHETLWLCGHFVRLCGSVATCVLDQSAQNHPSSPRLYCLSISKTSLGKVFSRLNVVVSCWSWQWQRQVKSQDDYCDLCVGLVDKPDRKHNQMN